MNKINNYFLLSVLYFIMFNINAQDIEVYKRLKNDNFNFPNVPSSLTFKEFQILERNLTVKDMMYAMIVPGYTHFYAQENKYGYSLLAIRVIGYSGLLYLLTANDVKIENYSIKINSNSLTSYELDKKQKTSESVLIASSALIVSSYLFDWIHGSYILKEKQENIRFKYRIQLSYLPLIYHKGNPLLSITFSI
ncbi:MAG: hypothetical protein GXO79_11270 [Chlorobi bacterium]|nr:hypothetical protein [Chlorobiota bacterium]